MAAMLRSQFHFAGTEGKGGSPPLKIVRSFVSLVSLILSLAALGKARPMPHPPRIAAARVALNTLDSSMNRLNAPVRAFGRERDASKRKPAVAFPTGDPVHLAVRRHVHLRRILVVVEVEDQAPGGPAVLRKRRHVPPVTSLDQARHLARAAADRRLGTPIAAAVRAPSIGVRDGFMGGSEFV